MTPIPRRDLPRRRLLPLLILPLGLHCSAEADAGSGSAPSQARGGPSAAASAPKEIRDLVAALTPLSAEAPPIETNEWHLKRKRMLERARSLGPEAGTEAFRVYTDRTGTFPEVRSGLLDVAAHTHPELVTDHLIELIGEFGPDMHLRTRACSFLAVAAPERAVELLEPLILRPPSGRTYPEAERMLLAWDEAARASDHDRAPLLCAVVTDTSRKMDLRHAATRALGTFRSAQGRQALELLMVQSGGNTYVRRLATQSLIKTIPGEELCPLVRRVLERESDVPFQIFLDNVLQENCR